MRMSLPDAIEHCRKVLAECSPEGSGWAIEFNGSPSGEVKVTMRVTVPGSVPMIGSTAALAAVQAMEER